MGGSEDDRELGWSGLQKLNMNETSLESLEEMIKSRWAGGVLSSFSGIFTFSSIILIVGALGVSIAFFPVLWSIFEYLYEIIGPILLFLHRILLPFYALFCYTFLLYVIIISENFSKDVAPFAILLSGLLASATYVGFGSRLDRPRDNAAATLLYSFILVTFSFPAVNYQSQVLGFAAVVALFSLLGFVVVPMGCGWMVGWMKPDTVLVTALTAGSLSLVLILRKVVDRLESSDTIALSIAFFDYFFKPFSSGFSVFGSMTLLLAGLIWSSRYYKNSDLIKYPAANVANIILILLYVGLGAILGDDSFRNSGATFLVLYLSQKTFEAEFMSIWFAILFGSAGLVGVGFFLKSHPHFLLSLLANLD